MMSGLFAGEQEPFNGVEKRYQHQQGNDRYNEVIPPGIRSSAVRGIAQQPGLFTRTGLAGRSGEPGKTANHYYDETFLHFFTLSMTCFTSSRLIVFA